MPGLKINFQGDTYIASINEDGILTLIINLQLKDQNLSPDIQLTSYTTSNGVRSTWLNQQVDTGDRFYVEVVDDISPTKPKKVEVIDSEDTILQGKIRAYHMIKKELEALGHI